LGIHSIGILAAIGLIAILAGLTLIRGKQIQTLLIIAPAIIFLFSLDFVSFDPTQFSVYAIYWFQEIGLD